MADVLKKTAIDYRRSVNTPDFPEADWFHNPDVSAVYPVVPQKYWRVGTNPVEEMDAGQKAAVDSAETAAALASAKATADAAIDGLDGYEARALAKLMLDEINNLRQWITSFKAAVAAAGSLTALKNNVAALPNTPDRTLAQAKTAYKNLIAGSDLDE